MQFRVHLNELTQFIVWAYGTLSGYLRQDNLVGQLGEAQPSAGNDSTFQRCLQHPMGNRA